MAVILKIPNDDISGICRRPIDVVLVLRSFGSAKC